MSNWYVLDANGNAVHEPDMLKAALWFETAERHVAQDEINGYRVSTVFLGMDHQFGDGPPVLWETMIFPPPGKEEFDYQERYTSREEALAGHAKACETVKAMQIPPTPLDERPTT